MSRHSMLLIVTFTIATLIVAQHNWDLLAQDLTGWRQTSIGWIHFPATKAVVNDVEQPPTVHPLVIGLLQLLMSVGALLAFTPSKQLNRYFVRYFRS